MAGPRPRWYSERMADIRSFFQTELLVRVEPMRNELFAARFPGVRGRRSDYYSRWVGYTADGRGPFPVERVIEYKSQPSRHECNSRCMNGHVNGTCECSCGGANHGIGNVLRAAGIPT